MKTTDDKEKIVNEEEQLHPVNPLDNYGDTSVTPEEKKQGYSEGNRNDSDTAASTDEEKNDSKWTEPKEK